MDKVQWKVEGMTCSNCALTIHKFLEKEGMKNVKVNAIAGDVSFEANGTYSQEQVAKGIAGLGYRVSSQDSGVRSQNKRFLSTNLRRFLFCLPFTLVLMLRMIPGVHIHWLMKPWIQLSLVLPVYIVGMSF